LILALFQLLETRAGSVAIDGVDLATVDRETLRSRLATVPQEPLIFRDLTIRENLSLNAKTDDSRIEHALETVGLWGSVLDVSMLDRPISEAGLSQGQSQLFCVARALLRESALVIFDEATSR
jgi:ATP-binding cassette subfamily C (CFTR/MRP) protein 1